MSQVVAGVLPARGNRSWCERPISHSNRGFSHHQLEAQASYKLALDTWVHGKKKCKHLSIIEPLAESGISLLKASVCVCVC